MTVTISKSSLANIVNAASSVAKKGTAVDCVSLSAGGGKLTAQATDMENWITMASECVGDLDEIHIDAVKLREVVSGMRGDLVTIHTDAGYLHLAAKGGGKRKVMTRQLTYPHVTPPKGPSANFDIDRLRDCLGFCAPAMMMDESINGGAFTGVHIHVVDGSYRAVSTDKKKIAAIDISPVGSGDDVKATLTRQTLAMLKHVPDGVNVDVIFGEGRVSFTWDSGSIVAKKMASDFVDYSKLVRQYEHHLTVRPSEMLAAIKSVSAVAADEIAAKSKRVRIMLSDDAVIQSRNHNGDEAEEPIDAAWDGPDGELVFTASFMSDLIGGFGDSDVHIGIEPFNGQGEPVAASIRSDSQPDRFGIFMPLKFM